MFMRTALESVFSVSESCSLLTLFTHLDNFQHFCTHFTEFQQYSAKIKALGFEYLKVKNLIFLFCRDKT